MNRAEFPKKADPRIKAQDCGYPEETEVAVWKRAGSLLYMVSLESEKVHRRVSQRPIEFVSEAVS